MLVWKFNSLDAQIASVRYRGLKPFQCFANAGRACRAYWGSQGIDWQGVRLLINVKSYTFHDLFLVQSAHRRRIPVILDLCDNIFIDTYTSDKTKDPAEFFRAMARCAVAITTPTEALASEIRKNVPEFPVHVIPDGIETPEDIRVMEAFVRRVTEPAAAGRVARTVRGGAALLDPKGLRSFLGRVRRDYRYVRMDVRRKLRVKFVHAQSLLSKQPVKRILWFGNHGAQHASFGMLDLELLRPALERLSREMRIELVVMSNSWGKYDSHIRSFDVPSRYVEWSPTMVFRWLAEVDVVVAPNGKDAFSICKSANRGILALAQGVPVVATDTEAYAPLRSCVLFEDWYENIRAYLTDPELVELHLTKARAVLDEVFSDQVVRAQWAELVESVETAAKGSSKRKVAFFLGLVQDLEIVSNLIRRSKDEFDVVVLIDVALVVAFPHVWDQMEPFEPVLIRQVGLDELSPLLRWVDLLVTASESNLRPHAAARRMTKLANSMGIRTATLQHGVENIGLTYDDQAQPIRKIEFASDLVLTWGPETVLHPGVSEATRDKCVPIGCPKDFNTESTRIRELEGFRSVVGVFENLHWTRYDDGYRTGFLECLAEVTEAFPDVGFAVKPHPAGDWLTGRYEGPIPKGQNLIILSPGHEDFRHLSASMIFPLLDAVITTPSTVALDALMANLPVGMVAGGGVFEAYEPLCMLRDASDWRQFIARSCEDDAAFRHDLESRRSRFLESRIVPGDPFEAFAVIVEGPQLPAGG